jgi:hypothetical protein
MPGCTDFSLYYASVHPAAFAELRDLDTLTVIATTSDAPITCLAFVTSLATYDALIYHTCNYTYARTCAGCGSACATYRTACTTYRSV